MPSVSELKQFLCDGGIVPFPDISQNKAERGECRTIAEKPVEGGFTFPVNTMWVFGSGKACPAIIGAVRAPVH